MENDDRVRHRGSHGQVWNTLPRESAAIDEVHARMGDLQKATVRHVFDMREILDPDQQLQFDRKVSAALTRDPRD